MKSQNEFTNPEEQLRVENEILKLKLKTELGALEINVPDDMPPALANAWLNSIYSFEKNQLVNENKKSVFDHLGKPIFKKTEELSPKEVKAALENLLQLLKDKGLKLEVICKYEPEIIYNFIVNELFPYEVIHIYEPGAFTVFIYEEFHPNIDYDIRRVTTDFLWSFFDQRPLNYFNRMYLNDTIHTKNGKTISSDECLLLLTDVQEAYKNRKLHDVEIKEVSFDDKGGKSTSMLTYCLDGKETMKALAVLEFSSDHYFYTICRISIPQMLEL